MKEFFIVCETRKAGYMIKSAIVAENRPQFSPDTGRREGFIHCCSGNPYDCIRFIEGHGVAEVKIKIIKD